MYVNCKTAETPKSYVCKVRGYFVFLYYVFTQLKGQGHQIDLKYVDKN
jgi:hypothetical protein